jgi:hypothetical protein
MRGAAWAVTTAATVQLIGSALVIVLAEYNGRGEKQYEE